MNWTPDRPTKPGKYWLARRGNAVRVVELTPGGFVWDVPETSWEEEIESAYFAGAQWLPYVEPPDPFAEPVPSLRERVEALKRYGAWTPDSGGAVVLAEKEGAYLLRSEVLALLDEVTR